MRIVTARGFLVVITLAAPTAAQRVPATTIGPAGGQNRLGIATAGSSTYVAWTDYVHVGIRRSTDGGGTWSPPVAVDRSFSCWSDDVRVAASGTSVFAVWTGSGNCGPFGPNDSRIRFNRSNDGGATWLPADVVISGASSPGRAYRSQLAVDGNALYVVWEDDRDGLQNVYFNRSLDGGVTWLPAPVRLDTDAPGAAISSRPRIAASGGAVFVTWMEYRHGPTSVYFNRSLNQGTSWLASDVRLDVGTPAGTTITMEPEIAAAGLSVCVVWRDKRHWPGSFDHEADIYCNRSLDGGTTWLGTDVRIGPGPNPGAWGCLEAGVARVGSSVHVCWRDTRLVAWNIYATRSLDDGTTWNQPETRLNGGTAPGAGFAMLPQIVATPNVVNVVWQGRPGPGYTDVFSNRSADAGASWLSGDVRLDTTAPSSTSSSFHVVAAASATVRAAWVEGTSIVCNLPFGFVRYGAGTAGSGNVTPILAGSGMATIGGTLGVDVTAGPGGAIGVLAVGAGPSSRIAVPFLNGTVLVNPLLTIVFVLSGSTPGTGAWSLPVVVPADPSLIGASLNFQALLLDPGVPSGITFTNGIETWIG